MGVPDYHHLDRRITEPGNSECPFVKRAYQSVAASLPLGKYKEIPPCGKIIPHIFYLVNHVFRKQSLRHGRDIAGCLQNPAENGKSEKISSDDGLLLFKKRYEKNRIKKGEMVGNDDGRTKSFDFLRYTPFYPGDDGSYKREK